MHLASSEGWSVVPAGARSWIEVGNSMNGPDLIVDTAKLNRIIEHEPADLIATAEAGVTLHEFNAELAKRGQWLPLDPPDDGRATLGGVVATGLAGPQRIGYGSPRTFVIGMKVVLADGTQIKAGGRVVKNVAGYDLCKLFTGSYGTLGIITQLTFKLRPLPQSSTTILARGNTEKLLAGARALVDANLFPVAVELLSPAFASAARFSEDDDGLLLARFAGLHKAVDHQTSCAMHLLKDYSTSATSRDADDGKLWRDLAAMPLRLENRCTWRAAVLPGSLGQLLALIEPDGDNEAGTTKMWQASVAEGRVRMIESPDVGDEELSKSITNLRAKAESLGGSLVIESADAEIKSSIHAWGDPGPRAELMKRIKRQLDPSATLSPGRFATGA